MLYRIFARNHERTMAYAEPVTNVEPLTGPARSWSLNHDPVSYIDHAGHMWTCDQSDIVSDPVILHVSSPGKYYRIALLEGER